MMLTLTFHGELIAVRRGEMNTLQLNSADADERARVLERLVLEVQRNLDNFDRQYSHIPISKVVLACYPVVENLVDELIENIYVPVREMDLAPVMDFPSIPELRSPQAQARSLLAIGAALRADGPVHEPADQSLRRTAAPAPGAGNRAQCGYCGAGIAGGDGRLVALWEGAEADRRSAAAEASLKKSLRHRRG